MKLKLTNSQMEEIEGITPEYPYAYHHVNMEMIITVRRNRQSGVA